ncbi:MAG: GNAT family N-acetyltransferase [Rhodobiaceae bacterium]|nr:GNAT family N-acetyltransferase [Rhodobiaceae bacterium]
MNAFVDKLGSGLDRGDLVYLRPLIPSDINERYISWFADARVTQFLEARGISEVDALAHLLEGFTDDTWYMYAIIERKSDLHIGNMKIGPINKNHQTAEVSIFIGEVDSWGKGLATIAVSLATEISFDSFGLRKLRAGVIEGNQGSIRAFQKAGWEVEATFQKEVLHNGEEKDRIVLGIINPNPGETSILK